MISVITFFLTRLIHRRWDFLGYAIVALSVALTRPINLVYCIGMGIYLPCAALWLWARWELGESFTVAPAKAKRVSTGLYSVINHPIYLFSTMAIAGIFIAMQVWPMMIFLVPIIWVQIKRAKAEDELWQIHQ